LSKERRFYRREELIGKQVIGGDARVVGTVDDIAYDTEGRVAIVVGGKGPSGKKEGEKFISVNQIASLGDVVLLKSETPSIPLPQPPPPEHIPFTEQPSFSPAAVSAAKSCTNCGKINKPNAKFCAGCGTPLFDTWKEPEGFLKRK